MADYDFGFEKHDDGVAVITLDRPDSLNSLTFEIYGQLERLFLDLATDGAVKAVVLTGAGKGFCGGGNVDEIIGVLLEKDVAETLRFTRMTGDLDKAIRGSPQPVIAEVEGICVGAGAIIAMASDLRFGTAESKTAFLFTKVGLAGCDMGACAMLPRIIGQGRAAELLFTGRNMSGEEAERWGFFNRLCEPDSVLQEAQEMAAKLAAGPNFAHMMTKTQLDKEWAMSLDAAIEAEAQAQAICMQTRDFERAYQAFVNKEKPTFKGD